VLILPYWQGRHPDHYTASLLGYEACFLAGLKKLDVNRALGTQHSALSQDSAAMGEPHRPYKIIYATLYHDFRPTFVVDITAQYERRRRAILAFGSQFRPGKAAKKSKVFLAIDRLEDEMNQLARHYGQMIGVRYGEPFLQKELMSVNDIVKLDVRSI